MPPRPSTEMTLSGVPGTDRNDATFIDCDTSIRGDNITVEDANTMDVRDHE